jgi:hypothetical protein
MRYLLDSDWIINLLAGKADAEEKIQRIDPDDIGISLNRTTEHWYTRIVAAPPGPGL